MSKCLRSKEELLNYGFKYHNKSDTFSFKIDNGIHIHIKKDKEIWNKSSINVDFYDINKIIDYLTYDFFDTSVFDGWY
jgi:hypothetical protein